MTTRIKGVRVKRLAPLTPQRRRFGHRAERGASVKASLRMEAPQTANISWDYGPSNRKSGLVFSRGVGGRYSRNPAMDVAYWIRGKLYGKPPAKCVVYDAAGKPIAEIDPVTRKRTPLP